MAAKLIHDEVVAARRAVPRRRAEVVRAPTANDIPGPERAAGIDLDAARSVAREAARATGGGQKLPSSAEAPPAPLARAMASAARSDCREAYAGTGLFAPLFLLRDAVRDKGCKW